MKNNRKCNIINNNWEDANKPKPIYGMFADE